MKTGNCIEWPLYSPDLNPCGFFMRTSYRLGISYTAQKLDDLRATIENKMKDFGRDLL